MPRPGPPRPHRARPLDVGDLRVRIEPQGPVPPFDTDGEVFEAAPCEIVVIPGALRVLA